MTLPLFKSLFEQTSRVPRRGIVSALVFKNRSSSLSPTIGAAVHECACLSPPLDPTHAAKNKYKVKALEITDRVERIL
jgi:hypothetical protein